MSDLVARARTDRDAFGQLYDAYYPRIYRYCLRRLFIPAVAEDAVSEVFLRVASKMRQFAGTTEEDFRRWLYRIATNEANAHLPAANGGKNCWNPRRGTGTLGTEGGPSLPEADMDRLDWPALYQAILGLKPRNQAVVVLRFFEQMSHEQIAAVLGERPGTIRVALSRARSAAAGPQGHQ